MSAFADRDRRLDGSDARKLTNLEMSPFIDSARASGIEGAIALFHQAVTSGGPPEACFLEVEALALARSVADTTPLTALRLLETNIDAHPCHR